MKKKKKAALAAMPRLGPPENLRPAGAHRSKKLYNRKRIKAIHRFDEDGFFVLAILGE